MKPIKILLPVVMIYFLLTGILVRPVLATSTITEYDGLEVSIEMDKEVYDAGEPITATITVKNTTSAIMTIANLEQLIPDGYKLAKNSKASTQNIELLPNRTVVLEVTFEATPTEEGTAAAAESFLDKFLYGETFGIPNLLLAVLLVIAFVVFMLLT